MVLAGYETLARFLGLPTITKLAATKTWGPFIWGWWAALGVHFIYERSDT